MTVDLETATPMMRQYLGVKAEHPTSIVLVRMGDFYEAFYDDAKAIASLLDLTLTARAKEKGEGIPMAGVPHHAVDGYLSRLVQLGKTVVLVDQVEDPRKARGLVRREVTRILTPGTFVDPDAPPRDARTLAAIARAPGKKLSWGLASLDVATGAFRATHGDAIDALIDEVARVDAREVLLAASLETDEAAKPMIARLIEARAIVTYVPSADASPDAARAALVARLGAEEVAALDPVLPKEALTAAGTALAFAERTQLAPASLERAAGATLGHIAELQPYAAGEALILDQEARLHLELFRAAGAGGKRGTLIGSIDEAVTSMGGRVLIEWIARPLIDPVRIAERQDAVAAWIAHPSALDAVRASLREVHDLERLLGRVVMGRSNPRDLAALRDSLGRIPDMMLALAEPAARSKILARIAAIDPIEDVRASLLRALVEAPTTELGEGRVFATGLDIELDRLIDLAERGKEVLLEIERRERERTGIGSLKVRYNRVFGYFIEITKSNLKSVPTDYIRKQTTAGGERYYTEELKTYEEQISSADELRLARERELYLKLVGVVSGQADRIHALAQALAELDVLAALAVVAERRGWCRPVVDDGDVIDVKDGRHPVLEALSAELGEPFVPNDVWLGKDARLMIVTGPNMAGKSTIMRQTALIVILAQMGAFVPAREAHIGLVDRLFTRVGASDDLSRGRSTFMVEMAETARILRSATARSLLLLDEIGRGTSTFDGLAIAWAVAEHIHDVVGAKTMFATHYHELTELSREKPKVVNAHVAVREWNEQIVFLRKLLPGPTNRSYGVQVARLAGLPAKVVARARAVLAALEAQDLKAGDRSGVGASLGGGKTAPQLHLFGGPSTSAGEKKVLEELRALVIDDMSPRQALARLAEMQAALGE